MRCQGLDGVNDPMRDKADKCQKSDIGGAQGGDGSVHHKSSESWKRRVHIIWPGWVYNRWKGLNR
jgi:hypothetical protein